MPAKSPEKSGAPEASATPKHNGNATKNTTTPATMSRGAFCRKVGTDGAADESDGGRAEVPGMRTLHIMLGMTQPRVRLWPRST